VGEVEGLPRRFAGAETVVIEDGIAVRESILHKAVVFGFVGRCPVTASQSVLQMLCYFARG
jgi:hypothetical protein